MPRSKYTHHRHATATKPSAARRRRGRAPVVVGGPERHRHHRLAEDDDREEREALGHVAGVDRDPRVDALGEHGHRVLDRQPDAPEHVAQRRVDEQRAQPQRDAERVAAGVAGDQRPRRGSVRPRAQVERDEQRAQRHVGDDEAGVVAAGGDVGDLHGQRGDGQHRGEHHRAEEDVVAVEAIGVEGEALPGDEHGQEEPREDCESAEAVVAHELLGELGDRDHEDQVEEQLEPRCVALAALAGGRRAQCRRAQPRPRASPLGHGEWRAATRARQAHRPRRRQAPARLDAPSRPAAGAPAGSAPPRRIRDRTAISPPSSNGGTSSRPSPLQKRPGSYQLGGRSLGSRPMYW